MAFGVTVNLEWTWGDWHVALFFWTHCSSHSRRISCIIQTLWPLAQKLSTVVVVKSRTVYNVVSYLMGYVRLLTILATAPQPKQYEFLVELFFLAWREQNCLPVSILSKCISLGHVCNCSSRRTLSASICCICTWVYWVSTISTGKFRRDRDHAVFVVSNGLWRVLFKVGR